MSLFRSILQDITTSTNNSTTDNLPAGNTFTGTADETLGINGIQIFHAADQDCTLYLDQSIDDSFPAASTVTDSFTCLANVPCTRTYTSVSPYYRLRVTNNGASATTSLASFTGMTPIINPLPRGLSDYGRLLTETSLIDDATGIRGKITPFGKQKVTNPVRIIGTSFTGTTQDQNFWTETSTGSGSTSQDGQIVLSTGTTADSTVIYESVRRARHIAGASCEFKFTGRLSTVAQANNIRRCGVYDDDDGVFFEVDGVTFGIAVRKGGVDTQVQSGSFNGDYGPSLSMDTSMGNFVIWYWERKIYFFVNGRLLHTVTASTDSLVDNFNLPIRMENINENGNTTDNSFEILVASVFRLGDLYTNPTSKYAGTGGLSNATHILKYGAGHLHRVTVTDNSGTLLIYDGLSAAGTLIANLDASKTVGTMEFGLPFSNGLTVVVAGTPKMTIVYE